jgi:hypothetical protein
MLQCQITNEQNMLMRLQWIITSRWGYQLCKSAQQKNKDSYKKKAGWILVQKRRLHWITELSIRRKLLPVETIQSTGTRHPLWF